MGKAAYGWMIMKDENIPGTVVRTSTIPEELGRLVYLLTDKTGKCPNIQKGAGTIIRGFVSVCTALILFACAHAVSVHTEQQIQSFMLPHTLLFSGAHIQPLITAAL